MTIKIKSKYVDRILYLFTSVNSILALLMGVKRIPDDRISLVVSLAVAGIVLTTLWKIFGRPSSQKKQAHEIIKQTLDQYCEEFSHNEIKIRANVMMVQRKKWWNICEKVIRITCFSENMKNDKDRTIVLEKWMGCAGQSWGMEQPAAAYISPEARDKWGEPSWALPPDIKEKTKDIKVILSIPIENIQNAKIIGILNFDSKHEGAGYLLENDNFNKIKAIAFSISGALNNLEQY